MTETKYYEQTNKIKPCPPTAVINGNPESNPDLFDAVAGRRCLYVGCRINIDHKKADAKHCCDDHRIRQYYINEAHEEALNDVAYQGRAEILFNELLDKYPEFLNELSGYALILYKTFRRKHTFRAVWECARGPYRKLANCMQKIARERLYEKYPEVKEYLI